MKFYKGCETFSFFISTYVIFLIQILYVYYIEDDISKEAKEKNQVLIIHKAIYAFFFFLTFFSHSVTSFFDPGIINKSNNKQMLEFYNSIYQGIFKAKKKYEKFNLISKDEDSSDEENENFNDENSPNNIYNTNENTEI